MKKGGLVILSLFLFFLLADSVFSDEITANLESRVIESFDDPEASPWIIRGSKFSSVVKDKDGKEVRYPQMAFVNEWPSALFRTQPEGTTYRSLGIHGKFDRKDSNYIEIIPAQKDAGGNLVPRDIPLPGRVKNLDLWVWGSNFDFYIEAHIMDYRGITHVLNFGSIKYIGWKNLQANISGGIPQSKQQAPVHQQLRFIKFVLWTNPRERVDDFHVYIDQLKIFTDMFESMFDGEKLADPAEVEKLWSGAAGATTN